MFHGKCQSLRIQTGGRNRVLLRGSNGQQILIGKGCFCDQCHIIRCYQLFRIIQSGRIFKMTSGTSKFRNFCIHHLHKTISAASYVLRQSIGSLIGRLEQHGIETVLYGKHITGFQTQRISTSFFYVIDRIIGKCHLFIQGSMFQHHQCCQNLGNAGRIIRLPAVLSKDHRPRIGIHYDPCLCHNTSVCRPVRLCICSHKKQLTAQYDADCNTHYSLHVKPLLVPLMITFPADPLWKGLPEKSFLL